MILITLITFGVIHIMVNDTCIKVEDKYFRYQERGGIFGGMEKVLTTEYKADGIMQSCVKTLESDGLFKPMSNVKKLSYVLSGDEE